MKTKILLLGFLILFYSLHSSAQGVTCSSNIDFELGNYSNWDFFQGFCCSPFSATAPVYPPGGTTTGRITITSGAGTDLYGGFPVVAPEGGKYSLKLGTNDNNRHADRARFKLRIPSGSSGYAVVCHFAVVLEDPGHDAANQPRFTVSAYDSATKALLPCAQFTYVSGSLIGFDVSVISPDVLYKPWIKALINLSKVDSGKTIYLDFMRGNCSLSGHFGYAYIDFTCIDYKINLNYNCDSDNRKISAPPGFQYYNWYDSAYAKIIDTGEKISVLAPAKHQTLHLILTPYPGYGCTDTLSVVVPPKLNVLLKDTIICIGDSLTLHPKILSGAAPLSYAWTPSSGLSCTTCKEPFLASPTATKYYLSVKDSLGCTTLDSTAISTNPLPKPIANDTTICLGDSISLVVTGANTYEWSPSIGLSCFACPTPRVSPPVATTYIITGRDSIGCKGYSSVNIGLHYPLKVTVDEVAAICKGQQVLLIAKGSVKYSWSPTASLSCATCDSNYAFPTSSTNYQVIATDSNNCRDTTNREVTVNPLPIIKTHNDTMVCRASTLQLYATGAKDYSWHPSTELSCNDCAAPTVNVFKDIIYTIVGTDSNGCIDSTKLRLTIIKDTLPRADFVISPPSAYIDSPSFHFINQSENAVSYEWFHKGKLLSTDKDIDYSFQDYGSYCLSLIATNICGLKDTTENCCNVYIKGKLLVPNVFTPNGDGKNDFFKALLFSPTKEYKLIVVNRYGQEIFKSHDPNMGWDGNYNNQPEVLGVYYYLIKVIFDYAGAKEEIYKGDVTLIR